MKKFKYVALALSPFVLNFLGCSAPGKKTVSQDELSNVGPNIVDARTVPGEIELDQKLQPKDDAEIMAEVQDFNSPITEVMVRFVKAPLEIPMEHVGGSTWRAQLSEEQLKRLAIGGQTVEYEANVVAWNEDGQVAMSREPLEVKIKAPDLSKKSG